jgi:transposase
MSPEAFTALCTLLRSPPGPAQSAARLVLVEDMRQVDAARLLGVSGQVVSNTVRRMRKGIDLARVVAQS